jgi:hypothetical protein
MTVVQSEMRRPFSNGSAFAGAGMTKALSGGLDGVEPPLGASDAEIARAVGEAGLLPLAMSVVHMTGRLDLVRELPLTRPPQFSGDADGGLARSIPAMRPS